jgi:3-isopropylmalate/(R)-2-methylmalate dehydratase small subunit
VIAPNHTGDSAPKLVREGAAWKFGDRIDVEAISPLRYMFDHEDRASRCLAQISPGFAAAVQPGDILVAGRLFGHGPGHDHANLALKETGIGGVVARSIAPQFFRHSIDHGLLVAECDGILDLVDPGCRLRVDFESGRVENLDSGASATAKVPAGPALEIVMAGGLIPFVRRRLEEE